MSESIILIANNHSWEGEGEGEGEEGEWIAVEEGTEQLDFQEEKHQQDAVSPPVSPPSNVNSDWTHFTQPFHEADLPDADVQDSSDAHSDGVDVQAESSSMFEKEEREEQEQEQEEQEEMIEELIEVMKEDQTSQVEASEGGEGGREGSDEEVVQVDSAGEMTEIDMMEEHKIPSSSSTGLTSATVDPQQTTTTDNNGHLTNTNDNTIGTNLTSAESEKAKEEKEGKESKEDKEEKEKEKEKEGKGSIGGSSLGGKGGRGEESEKAGGLLDRCHHCGRLDHFIDVQMSNKKMTKSTPIFSFANFGNNNNNNNNNHTNSHVTPVVPYLLCPSCVGKLCCVICDKSGKDIRCYSGFFYCQHCARDAK